MRGPCEAMLVGSASGFKAAAATSAAAAATSAAAAAAAAVDGGGAAATADAAAALLLATDGVGGGGGAVAAAAALLIATDGGAGADDDVNVDGSAVAPAAAANDNGSDGGTVGGDDGSEGNVGVGGVGDDISAADSTSAKAPQPMAVVAALAAARHAQGTPASPQDSLFTPCISNKQQPKRPLVGGRSSLPESRRPGRPPHVDPAPPCSARRQSGLQGRFRGGQGFAEHAAGRHVGCAATRRSWRSGSHSPNPKVRVTCELQAGIRAASRAASSQAPGLTPCIAPTAPLYRAAPCCQKLYPSPPPTRARLRGTPGNRFRAPPFEFVQVEPRSATCAMATACGQPWVEK
eukprot:198386-Chlamydomonas_euryale.AAC.3